MGTVIKHIVCDRVKLSFVIFLHSGTATFRAERQNVRKAKITNDGIF